MSDLSGRVAIVTGGHGNLGAAIVRCLAERGARVVVADIVDPTDDRGGASADPAVEFVHADVSNADDVDRLVRHTVDRYGRIDHLVNNAAIWFRRPVAEITPDEWDRVLGVNLRGPFLTCCAVAPIMDQQGGGSIVNLGSQAGQTYSRGQGAHYAASKAGVAQLTRVLSFEFGPMSIRVNCVAPGAIQFDPEAPLAVPMTTYAEQTALGRFATGDQVADACLYFLSDASGAVTGQTLVVNAGAIAYL
jgi:3alpha(or 20beta)-hydroxysteroid dehydrogenase